jgi:FixJ family two-component response regulator
VQWRCRFAKALLQFGDVVPKIPKIAIVDDNESVREATKDLIRSLGYRAMTFASAEEYLESGQVDDTACLITDVEMPGLNGIELQSVLAARDHRIPIIFITAYPTERVRQRIERAGACGFFAKPFDEESFIGCLRTALGDSAVP